MLNVYAILFTLTLSNVELKQTSSPYLWYHRRNTSRVCETDNRWFTIQQPAQSFHIALSFPNHLLSSSSLLSIVLGDDISVGFRPLHALLVGVRIVRFEI